MTASGLNVRRKNILLQAKRISVFLLAMIFIYLWADVVSASVIQLPETGQDKCYNETIESTTEITCYGSGQDGEVRAGVDWPNPRFTVSGDCVTDNLTGLMWAKTANLGGERTWQSALDYVASINSGSGLCGYRDWHLPNKKEIRSLIDYSQDSPALPADHPFINVKISYWTSTSYRKSPAMAWGDAIDSGKDLIWDKDLERYIWPVRISTLTPKAAVPKTGQTTCHNSMGKTLLSCAGTGQDGDIQAGVTWPDPRFTVYGDCVIDNLTGLMWDRNANRAELNWKDALGFVAVRNVYKPCGSSSWRLPNVNELESLVHAGQSDLAAWLTTQGFTDVPDDYYWSSTSYVHLSYNAWLLDLKSLADPGIITHLYGQKDYFRYTWSVTDAPVAPTAVTGEATHITRHSARLNGTVNPNGAATTYYFEWGLTAAYGNTTAVQSISSGNSYVAVTASLTGLASESTYHYRLVSTNSFGTRFGADMTLKTETKGLPWLFLLLGN